MSLITSRLHPPKCIISENPSLFSGSCYSPIDFTSEKLDSVQPSASWKETESNPQSGSRYHREGNVLVAVVNKCRAPGKCWQTCIRKWKFHSSRPKVASWLERKWFESSVVVVAKILFLKLFTDRSSVPVQILGQQNPRGRLLWSHTTKSWQERHVQCFLWHGATGLFLWSLIGYNHPLSDS